MAMAIPPNRFGANWAAIDNRYRERTVVPDQTLHHQFNHQDCQISPAQPRYQGFFKINSYTVRHRLFGGGWSAPLQRELFERGNAAGVLLYDPQLDQVGVVEQFRIGAHAQKESPWQFEVVAGVVEPGESADQVARRETFEEAGLTLAALHPIANYLVSAGGTDEQMALYCGLCDLSRGSGLFGHAEEHEDIKLHCLDYRAAIDALNAGQFNNAALTMALFWLQLNRLPLRTAAL